MRRDPASYTDPNGFVFWEGDRVFRQVNPASADFMAGLVAHPAFTRLAADGRLVGASVERRDEHGLVLAHERVTPASYPVEWSMAMFKDAAALVVEMAIEAAEAGYGLADGHPWNVFFDGPRPRFLDWGSFTEPSATLLWPARAQFDRFCLYPLHLYGAGHMELARARLADLALGVRPDLALRTLGAGYRLAHPKLAFGLLANRVAENLTADTAKVAAAPRAQDPAVLARLRPGYLRGVARDVAAVSLPDPRGGWAAYYGQCPSMDAATEEAKLRLVEGILDAERPASLLDLGANTGRFSMLAARKGARVVALDQDDASITVLYREARKLGLDVLPLVMDLGNPTPASGWASEQRPDALARLRGEMAIALALIHHLVFTGNHDFDQVARLIDRAAGRVAVVEWVAPEDAMATFLRRTATKDFGFYTLPALMDALKARGFAVEALEPHARARQLLVCRRPAAG